MKNFTTFLFLLILTSGAQAQNFKFGKVSEEEILEKVHPLDNEVNAAILYRSVRTYYEYTSNSFTLVTNVHERIKIYNKDGFDWATKEIKFYKNSSAQENVSELKGYTYNIVDGKLRDEKLKKEGIFEQDLSKYQKSVKFTMPAVTEGSVIEFEYSLRSPFVTSIDDIILQYSIPVNQLEVNVLIPEFFGFKKHYNPRSPLVLNIEQGNKSFSHTSTSTSREVQSSGVVSNSQNERKVEYNQINYTVSKANIPALKEEFFMDDIFNYAAFLKWELQYTKFPNSTIEDLTSTWEGVSKLVYSDGGYEKELSRTNYYEKDLKVLLEGVTDPAEKARKIYAFVKSKVKWNTYLGMMAENGGKEAYEEGEGNVGDINLMLTSMLKYAGLKADPVLLSTKDNGVPLFPTIKGFNYVISTVELPEGRVFLDATDPNAGFGELPARARNWNGRLLRNKETSEWVNVMPAFQSLNKIVLNVKFNEDLKAEGKSINILNGFYAKSYRDKYLDINPDSYIQILEKDKGNIEISKFETENQKMVGQEIKESYVFELSDGLEAINEKLYLKPMLFLAEKENPFKADERQYPIIFDFPTTESKTINIMVPTGFVVESLPESIIVDLQNGAGTFKFITSHNGNFVRVKSELNLKNLVYTSLEYDILKKFYAKMVEKHSEAIVFKKA